MSLHELILVVETCTAKEMNHSSVSKLTTYCTAIYWKAGSTIIIYTNLIIKIIYIRGWQQLTMSLNIALANKNNIIFQ